MAKIHVVEQGEYLSGIAESYGFSDWKIIYNDPQNAEFKRLRGNPNIIYPGDRIYIPDLVSKDYDCPTEKKHIFKVKLPQALLRLVVIANGQPLANEKYELEFNGRKLKGVTGGDGKLEEKVPVSVSSVQVKIGDYLLDLDVGHLNPMEQKTPDKGISGLQGRLHNLGYGPGPIDGLAGKMTRAAISNFQYDYKLTENGDPTNAAMLSKLKEEYGC